MPPKEIVIWGAGKIGRGYVGDLFNAAGYQLTLVDKIPELCRKLQAAGRYTVVKIGNDGHRRDEVISDFTVLTTAQVNETAAAVATAHALVVAVYAQDFPTVARQLAPGILRRRAERPNAPLDIFVCANLPQAAVKFKSLLLEALRPDAHAYVAERIGVVGTIVMRLATVPPLDAKAQGPLWVWTDGFGEFPVDRHAFKGEVPQIPGLRLVDDLATEEIRKLYTYNMCHATLAYLGARRGYTSNLDCAHDPWVRAGVSGALDEVSQAMEAEYGFGDEDTAQWGEKVRARIGNPIVSDEVNRIAADPRRKLRRDDRLVGPALIALRHGVRPQHLARAIAAALLFRNPDDASAVYVQERIAETGLTDAVRELCELTGDEADLQAMIVGAYHDLEAMPSEITVET